MAHAYADGIDAVSFRRVGADLAHQCEALGAIGGLPSHTAVVARELGIPCAVNTRTATRLLRTGDRIRLDGMTGTVELLSRAAPNFGS